MVYVSEHVRLPQSEDDFLSDASYSIAVPEMSKDLHSLSLMKCLIHSNGSIYFGSGWVAGLAIVVLNHLRLSPPGDEFSSNILSSVVVLKFS